MRNHVWGNVKLDTTSLIDRKVVRFMSNALTYAFLSMEQATVDTSLSPEIHQSNSCVGLIADSGGGSPCFQIFSADAMRGPCSPKAIGPYVVTGTMVSDVPAYLTMPFRIHDVNYSISSACAISAHYIDNTVEQTQPGKQDIVFAGDDEELCWEMACEFDAMGTLSTRYNDIPEKASRTYDTHRDGSVIVGDGGIVVVKELEHALTRGAHIYAEIVGYDATSGGADMVVPSDEGAARCMKMAMYDVDTPIDYLNSHGTSAPVGDVKELAAIHEVLGNKSPAISATKAMTGHSLGAAGAQEVIYSLLILEHGLITPSINIEELDEQAAGLNTMTETTDRELIIVMSNSFGFGGTNAMLVIRKLED